MPEDDDRIMAVATSNDDLILRSTPQACVSKDGQQHDWLPPFEMPRGARLLRVRFLLNVDP
jgi:hypothetical protein